MTVLRFTVLGKAQPAGSKRAFAIRKGGMIDLHPQCCRSCRRPWCATPEAVRRHRFCAFCGAASIQTGSPAKASRC